MPLWTETEPPLLEGCLEEPELLVAPQGCCACTQAADALPALLSGVCRWVQTDLHLSKETSLGCQTQYLSRDPVLALQDQAPSVQSTSATQCQTWPVGLRTWRGQCLGSSRSPAPCTGGVCTTNPPTLDKVLQRIPNPVLEGF